MKTQYETARFKSGFSVSVQASKGSYCEPRNDIGPYTEVELGFPNAPEPLIIGFAEMPDDPTGTVYGWVPVGVVKALSVKHGGLVEGQMPPFEMNTNQSAIFAEAMLEVK